MVDRAGGFDALFFGHAPACAHALNIRLNSSAAVAFADTLLVAALGDQARKPPKRPLEEMAEDSTPTAGNVMTAKEALDTANVADRGARLGRYETICARRGCLREPLANDPGRWTWCPDCLTVYDD